MNTRSTRHLYFKNLPFYATENDIDKYSVYLTNLYPVSGVEIDKKRGIWFLTYETDIS